MARLDASESRPWRIVRAILDVFQGRTNATGTFTCAAGQTSTAVTSPVVSADDAIFLMPKTANAAAEIAAGTLYVSSVAAGTFTVTHANAGSTDRTFRYLVAGE